jgi:hypothetical protein
MGRTFEKIAAAAKREPFPFPMPGGESVMIAQPTINVDGDRGLYRRGRSGPGNP